MTDLYRFFILLAPDDGGEARAEGGPVQVRRDLRTSGHGGGEERDEGGLRPVPQSQETHPEKFGQREFQKNL